HDHVGGQSSRADPAPRLRPSRDRSHGRRSEGVHEAVDRDAETADRGRYRARRRDLPREREVVAADEMSAHSAALTAGLCAVLAAIALAQTAVPRLPPAPANPPAPSLQAPLD